MAVADVISHCLAKPGAEETYPLGDAEMVVKVGGRAFAFVGLGAGTVTVTCAATAEAAAPPVSS
jgi:predicted DNA-binding protein (MmcQ/YjbR family)